ncbi:MAG: lactonase family protein [Bryobacteraceae bacterium]
MASTTTPLSSSSYFLYVGTYGKGIYGFRYEKDGSLGPLGLVGEIVNPSWLITDLQHRFLYAASELEGDNEGSVGAFEINSKTGELKPLNAVSSSGVAPCHLAVDRTSRFLAVANYMSGNVAGFHLEDDGRIGDLTSLAAAKGSSVNPERQASPHAHQVVFGDDDRFLYVPDLGLDQILIYDVAIGDGKLTPHNPPSVSEKGGMGPRHMAFSPDRRFAYLFNELKSYVTVYQVNDNAATFRRVQEISSLPGDPTDRDGGAEILVHPSGRFVYASNRGPGTIAVFKRDDAEGTLQLVEVASVKGTFPRGMEFDPSGGFLLVGDQKENRMLVLRVNGETGTLTDSGKSYDVPSPVAFLFVPGSKD